MPVQIEHEPNDVYVLRITGTLKRSEFGVEQRRLHATLMLDRNPACFVTLENFQGWEPGADWNDLDFLLSHSHEITKIAIVADPRWEALALAFSGAGVRRAPVKFFPPSEPEQARNWLAG